MATAAMGQQQPQFGEKIDVNLVLLDAVVTDARGNQILGLDKDDFIVKENNVAQKIESVDYFTNRRLLNERESKAAFKVERVREDRYFVFFFDKPSDNAAFFDRLALARRAAKRFPSLPNIMQVFARSRSVYSSSPEAVTVPEPITVPLSLTRRQVRPP
jgi:hypothetical protein